MSDTAAMPKPRLRRYQFYIWHLFAIVTVAAFACGSIKHLIDHRTAKARFYDAIQSNDLPEVQGLLDHGADPSVCDGHGKTASDWAKHFGKSGFSDVIAGRRP